MPPKLPLDLIPRSLWFKSPRIALGETWWNQARKSCYAAAGNKCEACGGAGRRHPVEAHEKYEYDTSTSPAVQRVTGLIALCPRCHTATHLGRTKRISEQFEDPGIYDRAVNWLGRVNEWDLATTQAYIREMNALSRERDQLDWSLDFTQLLKDYPLKKRGCKCDGNDAALCS